MDKKNEPSKPEPKKTGGKKNSALLWSLKIFILAFVLSLLFSFMSEISVKNSHVLIAILVVVVLVAVSILFDIVGVAFTSCDIVPFHAMSARKVKGAKACVRLLKKADKVNVICSDVIGDICGIVSGSAGAVIAITLAAGATGFWGFFVPMLISGITAALTVSGKSFAKSFAINNAGKIVLLVGRVLSVFSR